MSDLELYVRYAECSVLTLAGFALGTDALHGAVSKTLGAEKGFPRWFPTLAGLWELAIVGMNFSGDADLILLAQRMLAVIMGGALYTHSTDPPPKSIGAILWFGMSCAVPVFRGADLLQTVLRHGALAVGGVVIGKVVASLGPEPKSHSA
ncbi:hypothetical protein CYMTET_15407 [Cymbomonas tetramitiformis]|uniref:Uncharacterized protein n=1 Tax=Cymbomonas tetramitiformis TaxID=36881 RepID=A0AAE0FSY1_9CHLO|nr:hypothetical protein CYMTET_26002 [Cymbomonas tetramitiformis]KAK3276528.1 hypothetical protein CYMTET_15407 [Cymbomonas tetramitiformis]